MRDAASDARDRVIRDLDDPQTKDAVLAFYGLEEADLREKLTLSRIWPLSWPKMNQSVKMLVLGLFCYFIYKLAFIWAAFMLLQLLRGRQGPETDDIAPGSDKNSTP